MSLLKVLNSLSLISVINFLTIASAHELPCAKFTLNGGGSESIEVTDSSSARNWQELYNKNSHENVINISLKNPQGFIRLCYSTSEDSSKCENYDSGSLAKRNPFNYDVNRLYSVMCTNKKNGICSGKLSPSCHRSDLKTASILHQGKYATLFQDENCNECNFPPILLDQLGVKTSIHFTVITSLKITKGHSVMAEYKISDGNDGKCILQSGQDNTSCLKNLMKTAVNFTCIANSHSSHLTSEILS